MDYERELLDMGVDPERIAGYEDKAELYNMVMEECSEENFPGTDKHGNSIAVEGCTRCFCGCKYWENDICTGCGESAERFLSSELIDGMARDFAAHAQLLAFEEEERWS